MADSGETNVRVAVRIRPLSHKENSNGEKSIIIIKDTGSQLVITDPNPSSREEHNFGFDILFNTDCLQTELWSRIGQPIMDKAFSGFNGTIFAYGQTGSGKTWSMQGAAGDPEQCGIIPRMNQHLFMHIADSKVTSSTTAFLVTVSYFELYNEVIFDLLDSSDRRKRPKGGLEIKENPALGVYVKGLQEIVVDNGTALQNIIDKGMASRTVASTAMNADSSRSHSVFVIKIHQKDEVNESKNVFAKINLVDLAGSERVKSTGAQGATLKEGANINKSLSALGNVINALVEQSKNPKTFVPYRNSKLTRVLQESLGGNSVTAMLAALSPAACNFDETLSTLKYANRAKAIKVKAIKNDEASQVSKLNDEIRLLREQLAAEAARATEGSGPVIMSNTSRHADTSELEIKHKQQLRELEDAMRDTWEAKARISAEHEAERLRLAKEQNAAAKKLLEEQELTWVQLEKKGDEALTLLQVRHVLEKLGSVSNATGDSNLTGYAARAAEWGQKLAKIAEFERQSAEQLTSVLAYSRSLVHDCEALAVAASGKAGKNFSPQKQNADQTASAEEDDGSSIAPAPAPATALCDRATLGLFRQLRDRISAVLTEMQAWMPTQDSQLETLDSLYSSIQTSVRQCEAWLNLAEGNDTIANEVESVSIEEKREMGVVAARQTHSHILDHQAVMRGLKPLLQQVYRKRAATRTSVSASRSNAVDVIALRSQLTSILMKYKHAALMLERALVEGAVASNRGASGTSDAADLDEVITQFVSTLHELDVVSGTSSEGGGSKSNIVAESVHVPPVIRVLAPSKCRIRGSAGSAVAGDIDSGYLNGKTGWIATAIGLDEYSGKYNPDDCYVEYQLPRPTIVKEIHVQGGWGCLRSAITGAPTTHYAAGQLAKSSSDSALGLPVLSPRQANALHAQMETVTLPCGVKLESCNGEPRQTALALGDVLSWAILLKKQDPGKFLQRPPVRFLFDLYSLLGTVARRDTDVSLFPETIAKADWHVTSESKGSKLDYMQHIVAFIATCIGKPHHPVTTAVNIVTGAEPDLTNILLQQTAVCVYAFLQQAAHQLEHIKSALHVQSSASAAIATADGANGAVALMSQSSPLGAAAAAAAARGQSPRLGTSDLHAYAKVPIWPTKVKISVSKNGQDWLPLPADAKVCAVREVPLHLRNWTDVQIVPLENIQVKALFVRVSPLEWAVESPQAVSASAFVPSLRCGIAIEKISAKKEMSAISSAQEVPVQESKMSSPRGNNSVSGNDIQRYLQTFQTCIAAPMACIDIAIRVEAKQRQRKLDENRMFIENLQGNLEAERLMWTTKLRNAEEEKLQIQLDSEVYIEENMRLNQALLQAETDVRKTAATTDIQGMRIAALEEDTKQFELIRQQYMRAELEWEEEKEEMQEQLAVLSEERDAARTNEEDLFDRLADVTADLEGIQHSYVSMTEHANDAQDELLEAREELDSLKQSLSAGNGSDAQEEITKLQKMLLESRQQATSIERECLRWQQEVVVHKEKYQDLQREYQNQKLALKTENVLVQHSARSNPTASVQVHTDAKEEKTHHMRATALTLEMEVVLERASKQFHHTVEQERESEPQAIHSTPEEEESGMLAHEKAELGIYADFDASIAASSVKHEHESSDADANTEVPDAPMSPVNNATGDEDSGEYGSANYTAYDAEDFETADVVDYWDEGFED